jgi:D-galactarolactone cycloisomerase
MHARLGYDQRGGGLMAVSAIDMALWDLRGRRLGVSIATLLGGARRERAFAYAAGPYFQRGADPYGRYLEETRAYRDDGFRAMKLKIGVDPARDAAAVAAVRESLGKDVALMVDANQGYSAAGAVEVARRLEASDIVWLEEPVMPFDRAGYRRVVERTRVPVAGGEALGGLGGFRDFIVEATPSVVQPDLAICGGLTEGARIAAFADAYGVPVVPHVWGCSVNFHATLQWVAALPDRRGPGSEPFPWFEFDRSPNALRDIVMPPMPGADGRIAIPTGPGIGVEIDRARLATHTKDTWSLSLG